MFFSTWSVCSSILSSIMLPSVVRAIWPEKNIRLLVSMAWL